MSDRPVGDRPVGERQRFAPAPRRTPDVDTSRGDRIDRYPAAREELLRLQTNVARIVARGRDAFFDEDETNYLAASQLIVNFDDFATNRLPTVVRKALPDIPWSAIGRTRNILAHNYLAAKREIVWEAISGELPGLIRRILGS